MDKLKTSTRASWAKKRLPSLDLFKKIKSSNSRDDDSIVDSASVSQTNLEKLARDAMRDEKTEDAVYDHADNLARDCREFYERRLVAAAAAAEKWGIQPGGNNISPNQDATTTITTTVPNVSPASACSSGYFSLHQDHQNASLVLPINLQQDQQQASLVLAINSQQDGSLKEKNDVQSETHSESTSNDDEGFSGESEGKSEAGAGVVVELSAKDGKSSTFEQNSQEQKSSLSSMGENLQVKLDYLRGELLSLISQDNELFKQLLTLNDTIEELKESNFNIQPPPARVAETVIEEDEESVDEEEHDDDEQEINDLLDEALDLTSELGDEQDYSKTSSASSQADSAIETSPINSSYPSPFCSTKSGQDYSLQDHLHSLPHVKQDHLHSLPHQKQDQLHSLQHHVNYQNVFFCHTQNDQSLPDLSSQALRQACILRSRSVLLSRSNSNTSSFQRHRVTFPATGRNRRSRNKNPGTESFFEIAPSPPVRRELPKLPSRTVEDLEVGHQINSGFTTLPADLIKASKKRKKEMLLARSRLPPPPPPPPEFKIDKMFKSIEEGDESEENDNKNNNKVVLVVSHEKQFSDGGSCVTSSDASNHSDDTNSDLP